MEIEKTAFVASKLQWEVNGAEQVLVNGAIFGSLGEVLLDHGAFVSVRRWKLPLKLPLVTVRKGKRTFKEFEEVVCRYVEHPAGWMKGSDALGLIAESCGLRRLVSERWTVLAPNAVLHCQFGPAVTIATDGVWVLLWDRPWPGSSAMLAHRSNVVGPVTTTPTALWEWCSGVAAPTVRLTRADILATL